ncbi:hypothetical protein GJ700_00450 [Duganella sp. FT92W]|uniref:Uncharacterized protein n=1 Tax=Pseudoduganella rivuli TaxID=2666085 RepID=A0A7X2II15_9BURK|nr:hypothetical protein [Pseudoduganella rivuli]MRV70190.1 hypothetical protein [Pseudoduganella rivuli]
MGIPARLRPVARDVLSLVRKGEMHPPRHAFKVSVDHETLQIPYRLYYSPELLRRKLIDAQGIDQLVFACLGTRHYDGYLRQECLSYLLGSEAYWLTPYIVQLAGEYVVEIADDVAHGIMSRDTSLLAAFAEENPGYLATLDRRITSYWTCYHRLAYPNRNDYPGRKVLACLQDASRP